MPDSLWSGGYILARDVFVCITFYECAIVVSTRDLKIQEIYLEIS